MKSIFAFFILFGLVFLECPARANIAGGGTGTGANVTLTDNGTTVTMNNGIASIVITKSSAQINTINYTFNNTGSSQTLNLLSGGSGGGYLYWFQNGGTFIAGPFTESVVTNTGDYAEVSLSYASPTNGILDIHYSMRRGSPGFYTTAIVTHRSSDGVMHIELRPNIYAGSIFNWMSVDAARNKIMEVSGGSAIGVQGAPKECTLWTNGIYAGQYEDKYKYSANLASLPAWGWSSVGTGGKNIGIWDVSPSAEYYPGGPLVRQLMEHLGTTMLNVFTGNYYGMATDSGLNPGETWSHVYGPYLYYFNAVTNTLTTSVAAQALYNDALAQGAAEQTAWPYSWFANTNYASALNRGTVTGKIIIADSGNPNASAANLWVGLVQQPATNYDGVYDFQQWMKPCQFWTKTDTNGNFTIPNVIAGTNYTLYAFGPGAAGTFMSQTQTGGNPPLLYNLPTNQFAVTVTGGATNNLGTNFWKPTRVGATVFEIGYPDRTAAKFRHGDDFWVGDLGPKSTAPSPIWSKWLEYQFDFPNGVNYVIGQSRWTTDWNFCQPVVTDSQGNYNTSSSTITFNLPSAPTNGATASFYLGLCSDYYAAIHVGVNGVDASSLAGISGSPNNSIPSTGYYTAYGGSDTTIREGNNGAFTDERLTFSASALHAGANTITITFRQIATSYFANHFMYDYLRLEMTGYVPPAPASAVAYAGNNGNLVCWPVTPGATSYNILRSTNATGGFASITNGVTGSVCGSGAMNANWLDNSAGNGTNYFYVVCSVNPTGSSTNSPASFGAMPSAGNSTSAPAAPTGLTVGSIAHQSVTLNWSAASGANYYSVYRSTLANSGGGSSNVLSTILLNNAVTNTSYTDTSPTDGSIYSYTVTATGAGGTSPNSISAVGVPLPSSPSSVPPSLTASFVYGSTTNITLNWTAVPGAVGYVITRATSPSGPFVYLQTVTETTYTDYGLNPAIIYYYRVAAMNAAAVTANNTDLVNSQQSFPTNLTAVATNTQITLSWPVTTNATSYTLKRGPSAGGENITVITGYLGTSYTNSGLANGTTYFYVVTATGAGGTSGNSPEVSATPLAIGNGIWISAANGNWGDTTNWIDSSIASGSGNTADFSTFSLPTNLTITLDSPRTISSLIFGDLTATYNWTLTGTNVLTLGSSPIINVENQSATIGTPLAGTAGLGKIGLGALILGGTTNSLTGGITVNAGSLALDFTATNSPATNLFSAANSLTLGGGALQITGSSNTASAQTFASTTIPFATSGQNYVAASAAGGMVPTVNLGTLAGVAGGLVRFDGLAYNSGASSGTTLGGSTVVATATFNATANTLNGGIIAYNTGVNNAGAYATVGLYDWAALSAGTSGTTTAGYIVGGSQISGFYTVVNGNLPQGSYGLNIDLTANGTMNNNSGSQSASYSTVRFNANSAVTLSTGQALGGNVIGSLLITPNVGAHNATFAGTVAFQASRDSSGGATSFTVWQNNTLGELVINAVHQNSKNWTDTYVQGGLGTVFLNSVNTCTGQSYLNGGVALLASNGSLGAVATAATVNLNGGTLAANSTFALDNGSAASARFVWLGNSGGGLAATAGNTLTVDGVIGSAANAGPLTIGIPASSANGNVAGLLPGTGTGTANTTPVYATGTVVLTNANYFTGGTVMQSGTLNMNGLFALGGANYGGVTFNGGTLQYVTNFPGNNGASDLTAAPVTLAAGGGTIDLNGNAVAYAGSIGNHGTGALVVKSSQPGGSLNLSDGNNYSGSTTVTNATLAANNSTGSATGAGDVLVQNAGVLTGDGTVAGSVTIASGGALAVGNATDSLTIDNNLTLNAGSTTTLQIQHSSPNNSSVAVGNNLTLGGTLIVTNLGVAPGGGDTFQLFTAGNISGTFTALTLPALTNGFFWNTNLLLTAGTLAVETVTGASIDSLSVSGSQMLMSGSGGAPTGNYYLLSATNVATPLTNWTRLLTNQFDDGGNFSLTNNFIPTAPQKFYLLQSF